MCKRHAMVVVRSMFLADEFVAEHGTDDHNNTETWLKLKKTVTVNGQVYTFSSMSLLHGTHTVESFLTVLRNNDNDLMFSCHNVLMPDLGAVCEFATDTFFNQLIEVSF